MGIASLSSASQCAAVCPPQKSWTWLWHPAPVHLWSVAHFRAAELFQFRFPFRQWAVLTWCCSFTLAETHRIFFSLPLQFGIRRAASALHTARVVLSVGEILQSCCLNHTDKVSRPLPWGGESWCDGAFSKSRVRQGAGKGQDRDPCCQYCAHMDPFQLLHGKTWSRGLTLPLERTSGAGGSTSHTTNLGSGNFCCLQGLALLSDPEVAMTVGRWGVDRGWEMGGGQNNAI